MIKNGKELQFNTKTHGINIKTFETLEKLGYIENLEKKFYKKMSMPIEKLAFGNIKNLFEKKDFYNVNFNRTDKKVDINDEKLKKAFPIIFSNKKGLLTKRNYGFKLGGNGELEIQYNEKTTENSEYNNSKNNKESKLRKELKAGAPTQKKQRETAKNFQEKMNNNKEINSNKEQNSRNI